MKNQTFAQLAVSAALLIGGLNLFDVASSFARLDLVLIMWKTVFIFFLGAVFCLGWWIESLFKNIILLGQVNNMTRITIGFVGAIIITMLLGPFIFIPIGFFSYSISSIGCFLLSGVSFHASDNLPIYLDYLAKIKSHN